MTYDMSSVGPLDHVLAVLLLVLMVAGPVCLVCACALLVDRLFRARS